ENFRRRAGIRVSGRCRPRRQPRAHRHQGGGVHASQRGGRSVGGRFVACWSRPPPAGAQMSSAAVRAPKAIKEDRRRALVLAAFGQIAERGFEGLRTREVAAEAGVNIATLHYYFPTKEALIRGVVAHA